MALDPQKIKKYLQNDLTVHVYDEIDSTNNEAKRRADSDRGMHLFATAHQTAGRGRRGHSFYSPKDTGLYMTLALPIPGEPADIQKITCAAAVAVCEAIEALNAQSPQIKWVNDILIGGKKVAGILAELVCDRDNTPLSVIVGIGLNLRTEDFPEDFAANAGSVGDIDPETLCAAVCDRLIGFYEDLDDNSVLEKYKARNLCIGRTVTYEKNGRTHTATAVDIDQDGSLTVEKNGVRATLNSGEISIKL